MTRYPKSGRGSRWTVIELKAIPPSWAGDTLSDGNGLFGEVRQARSGSISVRFKYAFRLNGRTAWFSCGTFPANEIAAIRRARDYAKQAVSAGIDPRVKKKSEKIEAQTALKAVIAQEEKRRTENLTVYNLFEVWIRDGVNRSDGNKYIIQSFNKHILPTIGNIPIRELTENDLRDIYRKIVREGKQARAVELSKDVRQMLNWGEKRKPWRSLMAEGNPADLVEVRKLLSPDYTKERDRVLSVEEIRELHRIFVKTELEYLDAELKYGTERPLKREIQIAIWICLSTLCRIGELMMAEWKHVNFQERTWFIPKANTKGERGKKQDQVVYLSEFALSQFEALYEFTGSTSWLFPARYKEGHVDVKAASKQIGDRQVSFKSRSRKLACRVESKSLVLGDQKWTPHDLRRTGATLMQKLQIPRDVINLCQNHVVGSKVDRHYLHYDFAAEKQDAWSRLGDALNKILQDA